MSTFSFRESRLLAFQAAVPEGTPAEPATPEQPKEKPEAEIKEKKDRIDAVLKDLADVKLDAAGLDPQHQQYAQLLVGNARYLQTTLQTTLDSSAADNREAAMQQALQSIETYLSEPHLQYLEKLKAEIKAKREESKKSLEVSVADTTETVHMATGPQEMVAYTFSIPYDMPFGWTTYLPENQALYEKNQQAYFVSAGYRPDDLSPTGFSTDGTRKEYKFYLSPGAKMHLWLPGDSSENPTYVFGKPEAVREPETQELQEAGQKIEEQKPKFNEQMDVALDAAKRGGEEAKNVETVRANEDLTAQRAFVEKFVDEIQKNGRPGKETLEQNFHARLNSEFGTNSESELLSYMYELLDGRNREQKDIAQPALDEMNRLVDEYNQKGGTLEQLRQRVQDLIDRSPTEQKVQLNAFNHKLEIINKQFEEALRNEGNEQIPKTIDLLQQAVTQLRQDRDKKSNSAVNRMLWSATITKLNRAMNQLESIKRDVEQNEDYANANTRFNILIGAHKNARQALRSAGLSPDMIPDLSKKTPDPYIAL